MEINLAMEMIVFTGFCVQFIHKPVFDENFCFYNYDPVVTKMVLCERNCFLRLKLINNIKVVTLQATYNMPSRNSEHIFESPPHTPYQSLCLLLTDTL